MDRPIVTIVMPVYNVEAYVEKAIESICCQTLTDWEMIIVDDGSTDRSGQICDEQAFGDDRIQVIHQENSGAAAARNTALALAAGKYLFFMDADDWATPNMLYEMVSLAENYYLDAWAGVPINNIGRDISSIGKPFPDASQYKADVPDEQCAQLVIAGYYIETYYSDVEYYIQKQAISSVVFGSASEFREKSHELFDRNLLYTPWNKLYLASYIKENGFEFPQVHWDDFPFNLDVIKHIERVTVTDNAYYHFIRKRADSESEKYNPNLLEEREEEHKRLLSLYDGWKAEKQILMDNMLEQKAPETEGFISDNNMNSDDSSANNNGQSTDNGDADPNIMDNNKEASAEEKTDSDSAETTSEHSDINAAPVPTVNDFSPAASEFISRRYIERIIGCIENVTNEQCTLTDKEKKEEIKKIIYRDTVREALKYAKPRSTYMKLMLIPVKLKSKNLTYLEGKYISKIKSNNARLFAKLKDHR